MSGDVRIPKLLTVKQLAGVTGLPRWRIHEMCAQGKPPPFLRVGKTEVGAFVGKHCGMVTTAADVIPWPVAAD